MINPNANPEGWVGVVYWNDLLDEAGHIHIQPAQYGHLALPTEHEMWCEMVEAELDNERGETRYVDVLFVIPGNAVPLELEDNFDAETGLYTATKDQPA